jgi:hypothetical protein
MSSLLFLGQIVATLLLAYWGFKNDAIRSGESGVGLFAMKPVAGAESAAARPKWKKSSSFKSLPKMSAVRQLTGPGKREPKTSPQWKRSWRRGPKA